MSGTDGRRRSSRSLNIFDTVPRVHCHSPALLTGLIESQGGAGWNKQTLLCVSRLKGTLHYQLAELQSPCESTGYKCQLDSVPPRPGELSIMLRTPPSTRMSFLCMSDQLLSFTLVTSVKTILPLRKLEVHESRRRHVARPAALVCDSTICLPCGRDYKGFTFWFMVLSAVVLRCHLAVGPWLLLSRWNPPLRRQTKSPCSPRVYGDVARLPCARLHSILLCRSVAPQRRFWTSIPLLDLQFSSNIALTDPQLYSSPTRQPGPVTQLRCADMCTPSTWPLHDLRDLQYLPVHRAQGSSFDFPQRSTQA